MMFSGTSQTLIFFQVDSVLSNQERLHKAFLDIQPQNLEIASIHIDFTSQ